MYYYRAILTNNYKPTNSLTSIDYCVNGTNSVSDCTWKSATLIEANNGLTVAISYSEYAYAWVRVGSNVSEVGSGQCPANSSGGTSTVDVN